MTDETEKNDMTGQETAPLMHRVYLLGEFDAARIDFVEGKKPKMVYYPTIKQAEPLESLMDNADFTRLQDRAVNQGLLTRDVLSATNQVFVVSRHDLFVFDKDPEEETIIRIMNRTYKPEQPN